MSSLWRRSSKAEAGVVGDVIAAAHEGVDGAESLALALGQHEKCVIEILGVGARDAAAHRIGHGELRRSGTPRDQHGLGSGTHNVPSNFPSAARATSASLRGLEITGRRPSTAKSWRSMAFRISWPPRLKSSRSTAKCVVYFLNQRQAAVKPFARALDFKLHHLAKGRRVAVLLRVFLADRITAQIFERQIDSAFGVVDADVLPEIRQLQRGAGVVGKLLALGIVIAAEVEHEMADGIRRIAAVGEDIVEGFEAGDGLVLAEGDQKIGEFVLGNFELSYRLGEGDEDRVARIALVAGIQFGLPFIEQGERRGGSPTSSPRSSEMRQ